MIARRNQLPQLADAAVYKELFQPDTTALAQKRRKSNVFEEASRKRSTSDQLARLKAILGKYGVEMNLTPQPGLLPRRMGCLQSQNNPKNLPPAVNPNESQSQTLATSLLSS